MPVSISDDDDYGNIEDEDFLLADSNHGKKHGILQDLNSDQPRSKKQKTNPSDPTTQAAAVAIAQAILKKTWGFTGFRLKQEAVIARLIRGGSAAVVFPTGGGKSLTYQIPALAFD